MLGIMENQCEMNQCTESTECTECMTLYIEILPQPYCHQCFTLSALSEPYRRIMANGTCQRCGQMEQNELVHRVNRVHRVHEDEFIKGRTFLQVMDLYPRDMQLNEFRTLMFNKLDKKQLTKSGKPAAKPKYYLKKEDK
ncbi:MAG: hypothetical protein EZS28_037477 [Streblomastix strix]|uniref:Uncharacterized protein n=1 Tax=Streblomastix strix TaxID=222440 RepID=A0A5J4U7Z1_9EUKA|nr:MAG: hypothetical protein EZS28_037477 [Streblomastix strix]